MEKQEYFVATFMILIFLSWNVLQAMREAASSKAKALSVDNVAGAFLVLIIGTTLATVTAFLEFLWSSRKIFTSENVVILKSLFF